MLAAALKSLSGMRKKTQPGRKQEIA
jgi:hypothetical protein